MTRQQIRIYSASGTLLKDTTDAFGVIQAGVNSFQTFNKDGSSVMLNNADTTGILTYAISGNTVTTYENDNHSSYELQNIVLLNETNLELESILFTSSLSSIWGLDPTGTYKLVEDEYFTRQ